MHRHPHETAHFRLYTIGVIIITVSYLNKTYRSALIRITVTVVIVPELISRPQLAALLAHHSYVLSDWLSAPYKNKWFGLRRINYITVPVTVL